ncbi:MAG: sigma-70 family RNA polymerase sigma factor [Agriterribacter sp.]
MAIQDKTAAIDFALLQEAIGRGDKASFESLFHLRHHQVGALVLKLTGSIIQAEEITQEIFIIIWNRREELTEVKNFDAWLLTITRNHTFNFIRNQIREHKRLAEWQRLQVGEEMTSEQLESKYDLMEKALANLPPQQRKVFLLGRFQGLKYREIAQKMNISNDTVKEYLKHARSNIHKFLSSHYLLFSILLFWQ